MSRIRLSRLALRAPWAMAGLLLFGGVASAQDVTEPDLKAAYIYNFAKFTEWPADTSAGKESFLFCVAGDAAVGDALLRSVKDRLLGGHTMSVSVIGPGLPPTKCRLLYISGMTSRQAGLLVAGLHDLPVLTIADLEGFSRLGGIASFFFESGRLRFSINLASAQRARLRISSKVLAMAVPE